MPCLGVAAMSLSDLAEEIAKIISPCDNCEDKQWCFEEELVCPCYYYFVSKGYPTQRNTVVLYKTKGRGNEYYRANIFADIPTRELYYRTFRVKGDERVKARKSGTLEGCNRADDYNGIPRSFRVGPR